MLPRFFGIWEVLPETIADMIFISAFFISGLHLIRAYPDIFRVPDRSARTASSAAQAPFLFFYFFFFPCSKYFLTY